VLRSGDDEDRAPERKRKSLMLKVDEKTLDVDEEWLVRNALACYKDRMIEIASRERMEGAHANSVRQQQAHARRAREWEQTIERVTKLEAKIG
jgi:hypothetical protein